MGYETCILCGAVVLPEQRVVYMPVIRGDRLWAMHHTCAKSFKKENGKAAA